MIQRIRKFSITIFIGVSLLVGCTFPNQILLDETGQEGIEEQQQNEQVKEVEQSLRIAMEEPSTLHPIYNMNESVQQNLHLLFDTLVNIEEDGSITPNIAQTWVYNEEEYSLEINIRSDIKWHDGEMLRADDVIFSLESIKEAQETPYKQTTNNIAYMQQINDYNFKIYYNQPFSGTYQTLFFPVVPEHIYDTNIEDAKNLFPVGSGPYKYEQYAINQEMVFVANTEYFLGDPQIKQVEIIVVPDEQSMLYAFEQGLIDVIYTDVMDWGKYTKDKSAQIYEMSTQYYEFLGFNFEEEAFQNDRIREALIYGIDRELLVDIYYLGHGMITDTPISPSSYLYHKNIKPREYDYERAKSIFAEEGYIIDPDTKYFTKEGQIFTVNLLVNGENTQRMRIASAIQNMYKEIGVAVEIEVVDAEVYVQRVYDKAFEAILGGWKLSYIPDLSFAFHSTQIKEGNNFVGYNDSQMDELLEQVFVTNPEEIVSIYEDLQEYIVQKNPYISLYFRNAAMITKEDIKGIVQPDPLNIYSNVEMWVIE